MVNPIGIDDIPSVLIVDDNPLIVDVVSEILSKIQVKVLSSQNGIEALKLLKENYVDVIVCDVMMPKMDGYQLYNHIRNQSELAHIPFLFLTALDDDVEVQQGHEIGIDDYLLKPFEPRQFVSIVKGKIIRSRKLKTQSEERFDGFRKRVINTLSHEFRTPLVAINTGAELLLDQQESLDKKKILGLLEAIKRGGQRLERLVTDFMVLQQIEAGVSRRLFESRKRNIVVSTLINHIIESVADTVEEEGFKISLSDYSKGCVVQVCESQITDILTRLIANAVKFSPESFLVELYILKREFEVIIEIRDRGVGIDPEKAHEVVRLFTQIDRDRLEQQGMGLGLGIASMYTAINGGRLEFAARKDGGSIVSLILPLIKP